MTMKAGFAADAGSPFARLAGTAIPAAIISLGLLYVMHLLIHSAEFIETPRIPIPKVITSFQDEQKLDVPKPEPLPEKPEVKDPPKIISMAPPIDDPGTGPVFQPTHKTEVGKPTGTGPAIIDNRGAYPVFRVQPQFPSRPPANGGCVEVGFTITAAGSVADAVVLNSSNSRFEKYAIKAVDQFKYKPWISNGRAVPTPNQSIRLVWQYEGVPLVNHPACTD